MPSLVARVMRRYARSVMKPTTGRPDDVVRHLRRVVDRVPVLSRMPRGVARRPVAPGEPGGATGEWVGVPAATRTVLHHHGGGYVSGRPSTYRNLAARLARGLRAHVLLAGYRLAPEHPYPAALEDALDTYRALIGRFDPAAVAVSGDSAGGGLTLALLQRVRDEGLPLPCAALLMSPWADLSDDAHSRAANAEADDMLARSTLVAAAAAYLAGADPHPPGASPLLGDLGGLPPLLVTVDESEILLDDATRIVDGVRAAGGQATLIRRSGLFHVWPVAVPALARGPTDAGGDGRLPRRSAGSAVTPGAGRGGARCADPGIGGILTGGEQEETWQPRSRYRGWTSCGSRGLSGPRSGESGWRRSARTRSTRSATS